MSGIAHLVAQTRLRHRDAKFLIKSSPGFVPFLTRDIVREVLAGARQLAAEGMTLIRVTHEMRFARDVGNKRVFMHHGRIHESGDPRAVFAAPQTPELANFIGAIQHS
jgi:polar amino acid transport system ATP-binding protein